ncbi:hypothetical protein HPB52_021283 [Rhipicephalus sanguineus]|uniref:DDE-1 domain-containing protein n=1 Tax=Rhipicephalus sanguineus TaxID=34632 RepID=A0A9D4Q385_RHISA|nr:hypothetical protein HPB52_021283 [Rhipicephalus sanguineus]
MPKETNVQGWMDVIGSVRAHITGLTLKRIKGKNCTAKAKTAKTGMTKMLQPLDVAVNRSYKAILRRTWESWMTEGNHSDTATRHMRHATFSEVTKWMRDAWRAVSEATETAGFRKAGLLASAAPDHDDESSSDSRRRSPSVAAARAR